MSFYYIARQPILDNKKQLFAYELLFRDGIDNAFPDIDSDEATQRLVENSEFNTGISAITSQQTAFINFTEQALCSGLPELLPQQSLVIELLETVPPNDAVYKAVTQLSDKGYTIALDDFNFNQQWQRFLPYVDIIKVDFQALSIEEIQQYTRQLGQFSGKLLAEKVETYEQYNQALELGFSYFQGYFFARPEVLQKRALPASYKVYTELLQSVSAEHYEPDEIAKIIERDPGISFKLLRFVNSAFFARQTDITSLQQAVVRLGQEEVRKFVAIIASASLGEKKPHELTRLSITRAKFCEQLAKHDPRYGAEPGAAFLAGLLSNFDALMDDELESLLSHIKVGNDIRRALIQRRGPIAFFMKAATSIETANWASLASVSERLKTTEKTVIEHYRSASEWVDSVYQ